MIGMSRERRASCTTPKTATVIFFVSAMTVSCALPTPGTATAPRDLVDSVSVEWVTDPESDSLVRAVLTGDGKFTAGVEFPVGVYQSGGSRRGITCAWMRLSAEPDGSHRILQAGGGDGPQLVQIGSIDVLFLSNACKPWVSYS